MLQQCGNDINHEILNHAMRLNPTKKYNVITCQNISHGCDRSALANDFDRATERVVFLSNGCQGRERFECKQHLRALEGQARPLLVRMLRNNFLLQVVRRNVPVPSFLLRILQQ